MKGSRVRWSIGLCALAAWLSVSAPAQAADEYTIKDMERLPLAARSKA